MGKREQKDKVLEEFIGHFGDVITGRVIKQTNSDGTSSQRVLTGSIKEIQRTLKDPIYYKQCGEGMSEKDYEAAVDKVALFLESLSRHYFSNEELDKILFHCKKIDDLKRLYGILTNRKLK